MNILWYFRVVKWNIQTFVFHEILLLKFSSVVAYYGGLSFATVRWNGKAETFGFEKIVFWSKTLCSHKAHKFLGMEPSPLHLQPFNNKKFPIHAVNCHLITVRGNGRKLGRELPTWNFKLVGVRFCLWWLHINRTAAQTTQPLGGVLDRLLSGDPLSITGRVQCSHFGPLPATSSR